MLTKSLYRLWLVLAQCLCIGILAVLTTLWFKPDLFGFKRENDDPLIAAAKKASPSVVTILTQRPTPGEHYESINSHWNAFPEHNLRTLGSGVIVSEDGKILTSLHVIESVPTLLVKLKPGHELSAHLIASDAANDLAVIKINPPKPLQVIAFGSSDALQVGETVLAIGNPFSVGKSVTHGIISALGRHGLGLSPYEAFIQTDAPMNRGNSGGPLINTKGEMIGLNTAIYSPETHSTNVGIGFAIPSQIVQSVLPKLLAGESIERGYLGIQTRDLNPEYAHDIGLTQTHGVMIEHIAPDSPALACGLRAFDIIDAVDGIPTPDTNSLNKLLTEKAPGETIELSILRGKKVLMKKAHLESEPSSDTPGS